MDMPILPSTSEAGPLPAYRALLAAGTLDPDRSQAAAAEALQRLWERLRGYDPAPPEKPGFWTRLIGRQPEPPRNGIYLVGDVGRGKSMLMDLFVAEARVARKKRIHFHRFMQDAHERMFAHRRTFGPKRANPDGADPIPPLADTIAAEAALLCFDEFQVTNIADAMILGRLFEALFQRGVVVVATSNVAPADLFKGQPGRDAFLPFIALIERHLDVLPLSAGRDFRRERMLGLRTWHVPADTRADAALDAAFERMAGHSIPHPVTLRVMGRELLVPLAADGVARFDFTTLCGTPLGAGDYLAIANAFHTLILDGIPRLSPDNYDVARRFITLIDTLYDQRVKLFASADAVPDQLYRHGENAWLFERTASRLDEMQSEEWLERPHLV